jgi:hypothetical protein
MMNSATSRKNLPIEGGLTGGMNEKLRLKLAGVELPQDVHQPRLDTAAVHAADDMENPTFHAVNACASATAPLPPDRPET